MPVDAAEDVGRPWYGPHRGRDHLEDRAEHVASHGRWQWPCAAHDLPAGPVQAARTAHVAPSRRHVGDPGAIQGYYAYPCMAQPMRVVNNVTGKWLQDNQQVTFNTLKWRPRFNFLPRVNIPVSVVMLQDCEGYIKRSSCA